MPALHTPTRATTAATAAAALRLLLVGPPRGVARHLVLLSVAAKAGAFPDVRRVVWLSMGGEHEAAGEELLRLVAEHSAVG